MNRRGGLVLIGDVRRAPVKVRDGGHFYNPLVALWVRKDDRAILGCFMDKPGNPAQTLVQALREPVPVPGEPLAPVRPTKVVLFDSELAKQVKALLAPQSVEVVISPSPQRLDDLFADLFAHLKPPDDQVQLTPDVPDDVLRPLVSAAERLWRAKPWEYVYDHPPFSLVPGTQGSGRPLFAAVLGAFKEVFGVALYTSLEDYEATAALADLPPFADLEAESPAAVDAVTDRVLAAMSHRTFLVGFDPKDRIDAPDRQRLAQGGWPGRLSVVPTFSAQGGGEDPVPLNAAEASEVAVALDGLVTFCQRHRQQLAGERFPISDSIEIRVAGQTVVLNVSVPAEDPLARRFP